MGDQLLTKMRTSSIVEQDRELAMQLYGHPLVALDFISRDLERNSMNEWKPRYKKEPAHLVQVLHSLRDEALHNHKSAPHSEVLVKAARGKRVIEIPRVEANPPVLTSVHAAYRDWLNHRNQVKAGRWRHHYRGTSFSYRRGYRGCWVTTLCSYDNDPELRRLYPLSPTDNYPPQNFQDDAEKWRDDYQKPLFEAQKRAIEEAFGEIDRRITEFCEYCRKLGAKNVSWYSMNSLDSY